MEVFYTFSGLKLNNSKSEIFFTGINRVGLEELQKETSFKLGTLPIRYLGVPLVTKKLTAGDCATLVEKITARITC